MSTRWYPLYFKGNPQLRVFLPNFWMKLINPKEKSPPNQVRFQVSMEMSKEDVKNYLNKIYNVPLADIRMGISMGKIVKAPGRHYLVKEDDQKIAYVTLPEGTEFKFPDLFPKSSTDKLIKDYEEETSKVKEDYKRRSQKNKGRQNLPNWFGL